MNIRPLPLLWLVVVWVALWESLTVANVVSGTVAGVALLVLFPSRRTEGDHLTIRPLRALRLLGHFLVKLIHASLIVAWEVVTPSNDSVHEGIVAVPLATSSDAIVAMVSNIFSLTPGTLTLEIDREPLVLYVHVLHLRTTAEVRADLRDLERLVLRAFGSKAAIASAEARLLELEAAEAAGEAEGWSRR